MPSMRGSECCTGAASGTTQSGPSTLVTGVGNSASSPAQWDEHLAVLQPPVQPRAASHFPLQLRRVHAGRKRAGEDRLCGSI